MASHRSTLRTLPSFFNCWRIKHGNIAFRPVLDCALGNNVATKILRNVELSVQYGYDCNAVTTLLWHKLVKVKYAAKPCSMREALKQLVKIHQVSL